MPERLGSKKRMTTPDTMKTSWRYLTLLLLLGVFLLWFTRRHSSSRDHEFSSSAHPTASKVGDNNNKDNVSTGDFLRDVEVKRIPSSSPEPLERMGKKFTQDFIFKEVRFKRWMTGGKDEVMKRAVNCRMSNCFNWSRCRQLLQDPDYVIGIHIYPTAEEEEAFLQSIGHKYNVYKTSKTYRKILNAIESSKHFEPDARSACLFVPRFDTLSRDPKDPFFIKQLNFYPLDEGRNHLIFNLFSGTWPDYHELDFLGLDPKMAILAKASCTVNNFRPGFDISFPLFDEEHPEKAPGILFHPEDPSLQLSIDSVRRKALVVFKGKRYTKGIGSETRNALHHLHNDQDVLIYTTCRHGKDWEKNTDDRCEHDNVLYDTVDYQALMENSTFCLVPRGRRADTYRFLESLSLGCIPVVLSNDLVLPFSEIIDWKEVVVHADEKRLFLLPEYLRSSFDLNQIQRMRMKGLAVYDTYFSSVEKIVQTTIDIITDRIRCHFATSAQELGLCHHALLVNSSTIR